MIGYDERGIIEYFFMKADECKSYLSERYTSYCENDEVKIDSVLYGQEINEEYRFTDKAELLFDFNEYTIIVKRQTDENILTNELQYGEVKMCSTVLFDEKIITLEHLSSKFSFNFNHCDKFNDCLVCVRLLEKLLLQLEKSKQSIPNAKVIDNTEELEKQRIQEEKLKEEKKKQEELQKKQERVERFNDWFFKEYRCRKCGQSGNWTTNVCIVDDNGGFRWGGDCAKCKTPHYESGNMASYVFPLPIFERIPAFKEKFLKEYRCPRCGSTNMWYDMDFDIENDGYYQFSASCKVCDRLVFEHANFVTDLIPQSKDPEPSPRQKAPWETQYLPHPCPYCGAYKVRYAKWDDKSWSAAFWGFFSHKVHSNYKCDNCKEMWE